MASGEFHWNDILPDDDRNTPDPEFKNLRCDAARAAMWGFPMPPTRNFAAMRKRAAPFEALQARRALSVMLDDDSPSCVMSSPEGRSMTFSMRGAAHEILMGLTVGSLRDVIEQHDPRLVVEVERDRSYSPGARIEAIDGSVADLSPQGFINMLDLIDRAHVWRDGLPPPTSQEHAELERHGIDALYWLLQLTTSDELDCQRDLGSSIGSGALGAALLAHLDHPNPRVRRYILLVLSNVVRPEARAVAERMSLADPDEEVRGAAQGLVLAYDKGGWKHMRKQRRSRHATP